MVLKRAAILMPAAIATAVIAWTPAVKVPSAMAAPITAPNNTAQTGCYPPDLPDGGPTGPLVPGPTEPTTPPDGGPVY